MSALDADPVRSGPRPVLRRHWWLAAFLSLLLPGLGQLYAGRWRRAVAFLAVNALIDFPWLLGLWSYVTLLDRPGGFWLTAAVVVGFVLFRLFAIVDAALVAWRTVGSARAPWQRWYVYVAVLCLWNAPAFSGFFNPDPGTESYSIPGGSMLPTLQIGDYAIGVRLSETADLPTRGAILTYVDPATDSTYVKRLVGLPGDTIEMREGRLILNGVPVPTESAGPYRDASGIGFGMVRETLLDGSSYLVLDKGPGLPFDDMSPLTVPPGHVFLLGDNRDNSRDDRVGGPTPIASLEAEILYIYWSRDLARIGERLN